MTGREVEVRTRRRFWVKTIRDYEASGMSSCREFSLASGLRESAMSRWYSRVRSVLYEQMVSAGIIRGTLMRDGSSYPSMFALEDRLHKAGYEFNTELLKIFRVDSGCDAPQEVPRDAPSAAPPIPVDKLSVRLGKASLVFDEGTSLQSALRYIQAFLAALKETASTPAA